MWRGTITIIIAYCFVQHHNCDNRINDRYNQLISSDNLKTSIDSELPQQSKFFDINDFDCEFKDYFFDIFYTLTVCCDK